MGRREITTGVTMVALCGVLVIGAAVGWQKLFAELPGEVTASAPPPSCTTKQIEAGQRIRSSQVTVSVFNGGTRDGLADTTMDALRQRGFKVGEVGNAPSDANVGRVAIWSTEGNDAEARLVASQFGRKVQVTFSDTDLGVGVDVIVGNDFGGLVRAKRSLVVKVPQEVCVPIQSPAGSPAAAAVG